MCPAGDECCIGTAPDAYSVPGGYGCLPPGSKNWSGCASGGVKPGGCCCGPGAASHSHSSVVAETCAPICCTHIVHCSRTHSHTSLLSQTLTSITATSHTHTLCMAPRQTVSNRPSPARVSQLASITTALLDHLTPRPARHTPRTAHTSGPSNISSVVPNVLVIGDSVSEGYTPFLRAALGASANVQHGPDNTGGGSADGSHYGELCTPYFIRTPLHALPPWRVITFNFGLHDGATSLDECVHGVNTYMYHIRYHTTLLFGTSMAWTYAPRITFTMIPYRYWGRLTNVYRQVICSLDE
jgi:hypothetical protein